MQIDSEYLTAWLIIEEGTVLGEAKPCTKGHPTTGHGHRCKTRVEELLAWYVTAEDAAWILEWDIAEAYRGAASLFGRSDIDKARATALVAMVFQLGVGSVATFRRFRHAVVNQNWDNAAAEMIWRDPIRWPGIHTSWFDDTPARCDRTASIIRTGVLPPLG